jgi:hypothetical protein
MTRDRARMASDDRLFGGRLRVAATMWVVAASWTISRPVQASPEKVTYSLGWTRMAGAEACIGAGPLARAVETRLGHSAWASASAADIQSEGHVEPRADRPGWRAGIELADPKGKVLGQREIASDDAACEALEEPLVLMLALIIDPQLDLSREPGAAAPPIAPPHAPEPAPVATPLPTPPPPAEPVDRGEIETGVSLAAGLLPGTAIGLAVNEALWPGPWSLELGGTLWFPKDANVDATRGATFSLVEAVARACPMARRGARVFVRACAGGGLGVVVVNAFGFDDLGSRKRPEAFVSLSGEGGVRVVGPVWLGMRMMGSVPILRENFTYSSRDGGEISLFQMAALIGVFDFTLGMHF